MLQLFKAETIEQYKINQWLVEQGFVKISKVKILKRNCITFDDSSGQSAMVTYTDTGTLEFKYIPNSNELMLYLERVLLAVYLFPGSLIMLKFLGISCGETIFFAFYLMNIVIFIFYHWTIKRNLEIIGLIAFTAYFVILAISIPVLVENGLIVMNGGIFDLIKNVSISNLLN